jgi:hypothetical protein
MIPGPRPDSWDACAWRLESAAAPRVDPDVAGRTGLRSFRINDMQIDVIDEFARLCEVKSDWDAVYRADPEAQFFLSWTWMSKWLTIVGGQSRWVILAAKLHADTPTYVAFFPLRFRVKKSQSDDTIRLARKNVASGILWWVPGMCESPSRLQTAGVHPEQPHRRLGCHRIDRHIGF